MIVELTPRQWLVIETLLPPGSKLRDQWENHWSPCARSLNHRIELPATGWEIIQQRLMAAYLTPTGGRQSSKAAITAMSRIAKARNTIDRHPAMHGRAMLGVHGGWFPVWKVGLSSYRAVPTDREFVVLGPWVSASDRGKVATAWTPQGLYPLDHWLAHEDSHVGLLDRLPA